MENIIDVKQDAQPLEFVYQAETYIVFGMLGKIYFSGLSTNNLAIELPHYPPGIPDVRPKIRAEPELPESISKETNRPEIPSRDRISELRNFVQNEYEQEELYPLRVTRLDTIGNKPGLPITSWNARGVFVEGNWIPIEMIRNIKLGPISILHTMGPIKRALPIICQTSVKDILSHENWERLAERWRRRIIKLNTVEESPKKLTSPKTVNEKLKAEYSRFVRAKKPEKGPMALILEMIRKAYRELVSAIQTLLSKTVVGLEDGGFQDAIDDPDVLIHLEENAKMEIARQHELFSAKLRTQREEEQTLLKDRIELQRLRAQNIEKTLHLEETKATAGLLRAQNENAKIMYTPRGMKDLY